MKCKLLLIITAITLLSLHNVSFGQAPNLGTAANFVLFSTVGAVSNAGNQLLTHLTGNVGSNSGSSTNFGNVNGVFHDQDGASAQCTADLLLAYTQLDNAIQDYSISSSLGGGDTLTEGVYAVPGASSTLNGDLTLDAQGDSSAVFIFQIAGTLSTATNSRVKLIGGALACNVFWKVEGLVDMASGTLMKGTVVANNAAIIMGTGVILQGRALAISGAVTVDEVLAYTPIGCGSPVLMGPNAPLLNSVACYAIFSGNGSVANSGATYLTGDVGTNVGLTTGFNALFVTGTIHPIPDGSTSACATDLVTIHTYLDLLPDDIELLHPEQFGNSLVLTPHTYVMNGLVAFTDSLFLNSRGETDAVFVIKTYGAFGTSTHAQVVLMNGTQAKNVFWMIEGATDISDSSFFSGTIVCNNGAIDLATGVALDGRALTTDGAYQTAAISADMTPGCVASGITSLNAGNITDMVSIYPNPFNAFTTVILNDASQVNNTELRIYNVLGERVFNTIITKQATTLETNNLPSGIYFYKIVMSGVEGQTGMLVSQQ